MNVSTNFRHHPLEFIITSVLATLSLYLLKLPEFTLVVFFFLSTVISLWHHSNIKHIALLEKILQPIFITPEIHRLHHSSNSEERNSNYGLIFSFWDKLFSSYTEPKRTEKYIVFGLEYFRAGADKKIINVLLQPKHYSKK
jgi:sterol desaturase/sphingolipid hydroxylase (fatty acid hydroxylase superfamily)